LLVGLALGLAGMLWQMSTTAADKAWKFLLFRGVANTGPAGK